jgi:hypothetical protein
MAGHPSTEIPCTICSKPVDLSVDLYADEHGKAVRSDCYVKRLTASRLAAGSQDCQTRQAS